MNSFPKSSRLKSRKKLQQLFVSGKSVRTQNLRLLYLKEPTATASLKCGVGVSTKNFKKAVDRNRIKRLLREAYRLQKQDLSSFVCSNTMECTIFILYTGKELPSFQGVYDNLRLALQKLLQNLYATDT
ncbi:MAG TPA: ribonuclease P protein component [Niabella sp.]|nr:ribonuclease P protein component [Niabella sp.]HOZ98309.1 ribonuclease P protein component [Niabella sp.]HQW13388.1 ribonuclease P protein component [Niabella sp.]HQX18782.1 ribonuclease P protein component [Niabella sp.]HQX42656.1 ribonuclease P protein component [Niabella sp.]